MHTGAWISICVCRYVLAYTYVLICIHKTIACLCIYIHVHACMCAHMHSQEVYVCVCRYIKERHIHVFCPHLIPVNEVLWMAPYAPSVSCFSHVDSFVLVSGSGGWACLSWKLSWAA